MVVVCTPLHGVQLTRCSSSSIGMMKSEGVRERGGGVSNSSVLALYGYIIP